MSSAGFYRAFEERHRGSRDLIRERLNVYLPFVQPLSQVYEPALALDVGCGRGEWLELLQDAGVDAHGIDLDEGMLQACVERGLSVEQGDGIAYLSSLDDETQCVVSGFHVAEHISFEQLDVLIVQALRVLKPGGLLILETPNPENLVVGASNFFLDPSHLRPIPPLLLAFIPEYHGFARLRILRLQEDPGLRGDGDVSLMSVLGGASPDYAVVAQKLADPDLMAQFDAAFATHHGIELHELANRYDGNLGARIASLESRFDQSETRQASQTELLTRVASLHDRLLAERNALRRSWSWRITAPLRFGFDLVAIPMQKLRGGANSVIRSSIIVFQRPLTMAANVVLRRPELSERINSWLLSRYPAMHRRLRETVLHHRAKNGSSSVQASRDHIDPYDEKMHSLLTPHARRIFARIQAASKNNHGNI